MADPSVQPEQLELPEDPHVLRADILRHLEALMLPSAADRNGTTKAAVRASHAPQRAEAFRREYQLLGDPAGRLIDRFANGDEVAPEKVEPILVPVSPQTEDAELFALATLLWSVPVSKGYGRRQRYLVVDGHNGKLMGLFALGDPVFNLRARDAWIGWTTEQRKKRLVDVMDAFILGSVPPYSRLLGGKLVAAIIGSAEVGQAFEAKYGRTTGIISGEAKNARLALVTVTSALGRSSLYNRLVLREKPFDPKSKTLVHLERIGSTSGFGHFQLSADLFARLRAYLRQRDHPYVKGNRFGQGPNWRMRVLRVGLEALELDPGVLQHGIERDIYAMPLASNTTEYLRGDVAELCLEPPTIATIAAAARERWIIPRAARVPDFRDFERRHLLSLLGDSSDGVTLVDPTGPPVTASQSIRLPKGRGSGLSPHAGGRGE